MFLGLKYSYSKLSSFSMVYPGILDTNSFPSSKESNATKSFE